MHVRSSSVRGFATAKNLAIDAIKVDKRAWDKTMLFFTPPALSTPGFLMPMAHSLAKYPNALVYPVEDILLVDEEAQSLSVVPADERLVAGFDWQFRLVWEDPSRVKGADVDNYEVLSPSVPHAFAVLFKTLRQMGPIDETIHTYSDILNADNIEYSLRTWLCGGAVIKQQCSHVAIAHPHFQATLSLERQNAREIDQNVMNIASKWMQTPVVATSAHDYSISDNALLANVNTYKEIVFQSRFLNRIPYAVETLTDPIKYGPLQSAIFPDSSSKIARNGGVYCTDFKWFLGEVYPGLESDAVGVLQAYHAYILESDFLNDRMKDLHALHYSTTPAVAVGEVTPKDLSSLIRREELLIQQGRKALKIDKPLDNIKNIFVEPAPILSKINLDDIVADHSDNVRQNLVCEDVTYQNYCQTRIASRADIRKYCDDNKPTYVFACPKICGYCDNGKFCEDMYLRKCK